MTFGALYPNRKDQTNFLKRVESGHVPVKSLTHIVGRRTYPIVFSNQTVASPDRIQIQPKDQTTFTVPDIPDTHPDPSPPINPQKITPVFTSEYGNKGKIKISGENSQAVTGQNLRFSTPKKLEIPKNQQKLSHTNIGTTIFNPKLLGGPEAVLVQSPLIRKTQEIEGNLLDVSRRDEGEIILRATDMFRNNVMGNEDSLLLDWKGANNTGTGEITFELSKDDSSVKFGGE